MLKHFLVYLFRKSDVVICFTVDVEEVDNELDGASLEENCEHDDGKCCCDEHLGIRHVGLADHCHQGKPDCSSQSSIGHDKLLFQAYWLDIPSQQVDKETEAIDGDESDNEAEE